MRRSFALLLALAAAGCSNNTQGSPQGSPQGPPDQHVLSWGLVEEGKFGATLSTGAREAFDVDLAVDGAGKPVLAWADVMDYGALAVHRWSGTSFSELGAYLDRPPTGQDQVAASRTAAGDPVRFWFDHNTSAVHAARWAGSAWQDIGTPIANRNEYFLRAASGPSGPVVAWFDFASPVYSFLGHVARWDAGASDWVQLGTTHLVSGGTYANGGSADYAHMALAVEPNGDPVIAFTNSDGTIRVERWDGSASSWVALPALPATPSRALATSVAADGDGAVYVTQSYAALGGWVIAAVYRLGPGGSAWTALSVPPSGGFGYSMVALHGLAGSGVFAGWSDGTPHLARWDPTGGWKTVSTSSDPSWTYETRPIIRPVSDTDVYFGFHDGLTFHLTRWKLQ
jgi:hypothetical protein